MSLDCTECRNPMAPSLGLPGDDGVMVFPVLPSLVWVPNQKQLMPSLVLAPVPTDPDQAKASLCFGCIETSLPPNQDLALEKLNDIYAAIQQETHLCQQARLSPAAERAYTDLDLKRLKINKDVCPICGRYTQQPGQPWFLARTLNRHYTRSLPNPAHLQPRYSSDYQLGCTFFTICWYCLDNRFPKVSHLMSCKLRGVELDTVNALPTEVVIPPSKLAALLQKDS